MRRALLVCLVAALAGCPVLPAAHAPADVVEPAPRVICDATWSSSEVTVSIAAGNPIRARPGRNVSVSGITGGPVYWASTVGPASDEFPIEPGDSITIPVGPDVDELRVVVTGPRTTATVCELPREGGS